MARKTAMKKEPTVSIAVPQYEKDRLRGLKPGGPSMADGLAQGKPGPVKRLSPGVYRGPKGQLQTSSGRQLPRSATPPTQASRLVDAMNQQQPGQIATRPPAPLGTPPGAPQQEGQGSAPIGNMMGQMPQMAQADMNQFMQAFQQQQRPSSISGILQQAGQQQQPMMQNPQINMPMPELSFEQWKQMQMSQQIPQQMLQQYQPMMPFKR